jgi:hypothetical protein
LKNGDRNTPVFHASMAGKEPLLANICWSRVELEGSRNPTFDFCANLVKKLPCDHHVAMLKTCNVQSLIGENDGLDK